MFKSLIKFGAVSSIFLLCGTTCHDGLVVLVPVVNRSHETIYYYKQNIYPTEGIYLCGPKCLMPGEKSEIEVGAFTEYSTDDYIQYIWFLKENTHKGYSNEEILNNRIYDKLYEFSRSEMLKPGFEIIYTDD